MNNPGTPLVEIAFRNMDHSPAVEDRVRAEIGKLGQFHDYIIARRVGSRRGTGISTMAISREIAPTAD